MAKDPETIIDEVKSALADWNSYAKDSGVGDNSKKIIAKAITEISKG